MKILIKYLVLFLFGGSIYLLIEICFRGYSHPAMFAVGGICFLLIGGINKYLNWTVPLLFQSIIGSLLITGIEFISGLILNIWLGLSIWNYSDLPFNLLGQICLQFSLLWCLAAVAGIIIDDFMRWLLFNEEKPRYILFYHS